MTKDQVLNELKIKLFDSLINSRIPDFAQIEKIQEFLKAECNDEEMIKACDDLVEICKKTLTAWSIIYDVNNLTKDKEAKND